MSHENEHFIQEIEIKNYKLFKDFKAKGFGRVNLIGGKNNVGKTAFMEACFLISNYATKIRSHNDFKPNYGAISIDKEWQIFEIIKSLIIINQNRGGAKFLSEWIKDEATLPTYEATLILNDTFKINFQGDEITPEYKYHNWSFYANTVSLSNFRNNKYFHTIYKKNNPPQLINTVFNTPCFTDHNTLSDAIDTLKINNNLNSVTKNLQNIFGIDGIDIIKNQVMLKQNNQYLNLNDFGDGIKSFIKVLLSLSINKNSVIFIDEVENGIHYTNLDKLWEIILTISKEQNVQVFATTHSKECIESYARVAQRLEDEDAYYFEMYKNIKKDNIEMRSLDITQLEYELTHDGRYRGE